MSSTSLSSPRARARRPMMARIRSRHATVGLMFVLPCLVLFIGFRFGPAVLGGLLSLGEYSIGGGYSWEGLDNYQRLLGDATFWQALWVTVEYAALAVPGTIAAALAAALLIRPAFKSRSFFRSVLFLPVITSLVLAGVVFRWIFAADGVWAGFFAAIGLDTGSWLASTTLVVPALALVSVWNRFGFGMLIFLARLYDIPREYEEAAKVDGANAWQRLRHVIIPQLRPALLFLVILETATSFHVFDLIYIMTGGGPGHASYNLVYQIYDLAFQSFEFGYASAIGIVLFVVSLLIAVAQSRLVGRERS